MALDTLHKLILLAIKRENNVKLCIVLCVCNFLLLFYQTRVKIMQQVQKGDKAETFTFVETFNLPCVGFPQTSPL